MKDKTRTQVIKQLIRDRHIGDIPSVETHYALLPQEGYLYPRKIGKELIENLVDRAIQDGKATLEQKYVSHVKSESDGSCDIYYMQYHRDLNHHRVDTIKLSLDNEEPIFEVHREGKNIWGDWQ